MKILPPEACGVAGEIRFKEFKVFKTLAPTFPILTVPLT